MMLCPCRGPRSEHTSQGCCEFGISANHVDFSNITRLKFSSAFVIVCIDESLLIDSLYSFFSVPFLPVLT